MSSKKHNIAETVRQIASPIAADMGLLLWDVLFVKEGPSWVLRLIIDKPGGVFIEDCEQLSRAIDPHVDALDPTEGEYFLEVSSPGLGRQLRTDAHLEAFYKKPVWLRLYKPDDAGHKEYNGILTAFDSDSITIALHDGLETLALTRSVVADIRADDDPPGFPKK